MVANYICDQPYLWPTIFMNPSRSELTRQIIARARTLPRALSEVEAEAAQRLDLHPSDVRAMIRLTGEPRAVGELAQAIGLSSPATSGVADRLARRGLARRTSDPKDRRRSLVELTDAGRAALEEALGPLHRDEEALLAGFTVPALETIRAYLAASEGLVDRHRRRLREG